MVVQSPSLGVMFQSVWSSDSKGLNAFLNARIMHGIESKRIFRWHTGLDPLNLACDARHQVWTIHALLQLPKGAQKVQPKARFSMMSQPMRRPGILFKPPPRMETTPAAHCCYQRWMISMISYDTRSIQQLNNGHRTNLRSGVGDES